MILKYRFINLFSILESMIYGLIENLNLKCKFNDVYCNYNNNNNNNKCDFYIPTYNRAFKKNIDNLAKKLDVFEDLKNDLIELKNYRDNIHIYLPKKNEYTEINYEEKVRSTKKLIDHLILNLLDKKEAFLIELENNCKLDK